VLGPVEQAEALEQPVDARADLARDGTPGELKGQDDVLTRRQGRDEVEGLEDEPHVVAPDQRPLGVGERVERVAGEPDLPARRVVEPGGDIHERRLPGPRRTHEGGELPGGDVDADAVEGAHGAGAAAVDALDATEGQDGWDGGSGVGARVHADDAREEGRPGASAAGRDLHPS